MIRCSFCKKNSKAGETTHKIVVEVRKRTYEVPTNSIRKRTALSFTEVVKEVRACTPCVSGGEVIETVGNTLVVKGLF
jgi:hypothetical protein